MIDNKFIIINLGIEINNYDDSIFDGEYFENKFYCFDIIFHKGCDLRDNNEFKLENRIELIKLFINSINNDRILSKTYVFGNLYNNCINYYKKYFSDDDTSKYDGIIVVYANKPYSKNNFLPLKWKPDILNTIDFKIKKINYDNNFEVWELYCSNNVLFNYEDNYELGKTTIEHSIASQYNDNTVIEFYYDKYSEKFIPIKTRFDKIDGNYIDIARDNFDIVLSPFDFETLKRLATNTKNYDYAASNAGER